jgi:hypothetical protein
MGNYITILKLLGIGHWDEGMRGMREMRIINN